MTQTAAHSETPSGLASTHSIALLGVDGALVRVEVNITSALRRFVIVGLPDGVVREARERVRCAIENSGFIFPRSEVIVSLSPASLPKFGSGFDLAIAVAILAADGQLPSPELTRQLFIGELTLEGAIKPAPGLLQAGDLLAHRELQRIVVANEVSPLSSLIDSNAVVAAASLRELCGMIKGEIKFRRFAPAERRLDDESREGNTIDFGDVLGQHSAKRALEIAAAGGHNILFVGPPGVGKSMLARRLPSILPPLSLQAAREVARIYSANGLADTVSLIEPPFRSPHHTSSYAGLLGGGTPPTAGDISLAHQGVLFLDELPEFRRDVLEGLREPMESKRVAVSRSLIRVEFPANTLIIAAMNPCPCGYHGYGQRRCRCDNAAVVRYRNRISGPLLDRFDLHLSLGGLTTEELVQAAPENPTSAMRQRVVAARRRQPEGLLNSQLDGKNLRETIRADREALAALNEAHQILKISARGYAKLLRVARTIADLGNSDEVTRAHVLEAISYREPATFFSS